MPQIGSLNIGQLFNTCRVGTLLKIWNICFHKIIFIMKNSTYVKEWKSCKLSQILNKTRIQEHKIEYA